MDFPNGVAKRLADSYGPRTQWWKILNRDYSQKVGRSIERAAGRPAALLSLSQPRAARALSAVCFHCARLSATIFADFVAAWLMCAYSVITRWTRWPSFCR